MKRSARLTFVRFSTEVLRLPLTLPWRVLLAITIDGVQPRDLEGEEREAARTIFGPVEEIDPRLRRVLCWRIGRAAGKSTLAAALAIYCAWTIGLPKQGYGHVPAAFIVSAAKPLAKIAQGVARELVRGSDLERFVKGDTTEGFILKRPDGRTVEIASVAASKGGANLRGRDVVVLVVDESEFLGSEDGGYTVTDRDQVSAVMPRLLGYVVLCSTPWPTENFTAESFDRNWGHPQDAVAALGTSMYMRPTEQLAEDIAREMTRDEENARREYECVSGARGGSKVFDRDSVLACIVEGRALVVHAEAGAVVGAGGDLGLERDSSAIAIVSSLDGIYELCEYDEVRPTKAEPLSPNYVLRQRFTPVLRRHHASGITMDGHYRQSAIEHLDADGLEFSRAPEGNQGKYDTYMFVRSLLRERKLRLPDIPRLVSQLCAVTSTPLAGGLVRISSPRRAGGGHGDVASALVLGCWAAREGSSAPGWLSPGFVENASQGFNPGALFVQRSKPQPLKSWILPNGEREIEGAGGEFPSSFTARWSPDEPARFSSQSTDAFKTAVAQFRYQRPEVR